MDNKLKIINHLGKNPKKSFTMHGLSQVTKIPYATLHRTIKEIEDLVIIEQIGKAKTIALDTSNPLVKPYLAISSDMERKRLRKPIIKKIESELDTKDIVVLFGSYATDQEKATSDIDILVINRKGEKSISFSKYETLFNKKVNPIFICDSEFKKMLKEKQENLGKQVLKKHVILNNPAKFWELVIDA